MFGALMNHLGKAKKNLEKDSTIERMTSIEEKALKVQEEDNRKKRDAAIDASNKRKNQSKAKTDMLIAQEILIELKIKKEKLSGDKMPGEKDAVEGVLKTKEPPSITYKVSLQSLLIYFTYPLQY